MVSLHDQILISSKYHNANSLLATCRLMILCCLLCAYNIHLALLQAPEGLPMEGSGEMGEEAAGDMSMDEQAAVDLVQLAQQAEQAELQAAQLQAAQLQAAQLQAEQLQAAQLQAEQLQGLIWLLDLLFDAFRSICRIVAPNHTAFILNWTV